jgi:hypothetical protein
MKWVWCPSDGVDRSKVVVVVVMVSNRSENFIADVIEIGAAKALYVATLWFLGSFFLLTFQDTTSFSSAMIAPTTQATTPIYGRSESWNNSATILADWVYISLSQLPWSWPSSQHGTKCAISKLQRGAAERLSKQAIWASLAYASPTALLEQPRFRR